jgi:hypothetical protein
MGLLVQKRRAARLIVFVLIFLAAVALEFIFFGKPLLMAQQASAEEVPQEEVLIYSGRIGSQRIAARECEIKNACADGNMLFEVESDPGRPILRARM